MPLPDLLTMIKMATAATKGFTGIVPRQESRDKRVQDSISRILRTLYFAPDGILGLLKEVADGKRPTDARLQQALVDFNDRQWKIEGALEGLEFDKLKKEFGISLHSIMVLVSLREGKSDLRWAVQQEVNSYGQKGKSPNRVGARKLIKAIEELNAGIELVEGVINRRASVGPSFRKMPSKKSASQMKTSLKKAAGSKARKSKKRN